MGTVAKLGIGGVIGLLVGLLLVAWVKPATQGGQAMLILICVTIGTALGTLVTAVFGNGGKK